ncbi:MAG: tetratricopeptide repeat protein [Syntrophales bacterium]
MGDNDLQERDAFLQEVEAFLNRGDDATALAVAESRLKRIPGDMDARIAVCRVWIRQGRLDEATAILQEMEGTLANLSQVYASMGHVCLNEGLEQSAAAYYRKFLSLNPDSPLAPEISGKLAAITAPQETGARQDEEDAAQVPSDFQTVTLAELYIRQGHLRPAAEVLEAIIRKDPGQERAAELLREVWEMIFREESRKESPEVVAELSRWLDNIDRLRGHAG